jgi:hypothetical protein
VANDPCQEKLEQYLAAMRELSEATGVAKSFEVVEPGEEAPDLKDDAKAAFRRVREANDVYVKKYAAWVECRRAQRLLAKGEY